MSRQHHPIETPPLGVVAVQVRVASLVSLFCYAAGAIAVYWQGWPALVVGFVIGGLFRYAPRGRGLEHHGHHGHH